jgi:hypothetical protein
MMPMTPVWNGAEWSSVIALPAWRSFRHTHPDDQVEVVFLPGEGPDDVPPSPIQISTVMHVVGIQEELRSVVEMSVRKYYDGLRHKYVEPLLRVAHFVGDITTDLPENPDPFTFGRLHELDGLFVHSFATSGLAYVGFSFRARWEPEHGVGVLTHDRRVVAVGGADTALLTWIAEQDTTA